jgi:hypothetical protein
MAGSPPGDGGAPSGAPAPDVRPLTGDPIPVVFDRHWTVDYAVAAPPSNFRPRGTIVTSVALNPSSPADGGEESDDFFLVEVDLATGMPVRDVEVGSGVYRGKLLDGVSGPIVLLWPAVDTTVTIVWLDRSLGEVARRSFPLPVSRWDACGGAAIGDRVGIAACEKSPTKVWLFDAKTGATAHTCPGFSRTQVMQIYPWHDDVLMDPLNPDAGGAGTVQCAFRADGTGPVRVQRNLTQGRLTVRDGEAYVNLWGDEAKRFSRPEGVYLVGDDLRPKGSAIELPPRPAEETAAETSDHVYVMGRSARLVNGIIVLRGTNCCGDELPPLWIWDPHGPPTTPHDAGVSSP